MKYILEVNYSLTVPCLSLDQFYCQLLSYLISKCVKLLTQVIQVNYIKESN